MSDLGNGPNKPTATIIGEYSAPYHDGALISTRFRAKFQDLTKICGLTGHTHASALMSVMVIVTKQLVMGFQSLVMDTTTTRIYWIKDQYHMGVRARIPGYMSKLTKIWL